MFYSSSHKLQKKILIFLIGHSGFYIVNFSDSFDSQKSKIGPVVIKQKEKRLQKWMQHILFINRKCEQSSVNSSESACARRTPSRFVYIRTLDTTRHVTNILRNSEYLLFFTLNKWDHFDWTERLVVLRIQSTTAVAILKNCETMSDE